MKARNILRKTTQVQTQTGLPAPRRIARLLLASIVMAGAVSLLACATVETIPGTGIPDNKKNREIIEVLEKYRQAMVQRDAGALMAMAHPHYYEHSGTPKGDDDYGYKGLMQVIKKRMAQLQAVRYNIKYSKIHWVNPEQVEVELYIDASFQIKTPTGEDKWSRYTGHNKVVLTKHQGRWLFLRGM
jgi:hypothetical protein